MKFRWIERLGEWNPQLLRELKGRFKFRNVAIAIIASLLCQVILFLFYLPYSDLFVWLGKIAIFSLLVGGTYLLISDLSQEERRGTLNFLRLSPQKQGSIWLGKMLGVPILLYIAVVLAIPLHLWAGLSAQKPLSLILLFYGLLILGCFFFYSAALLFGLVSTWLGRFQAPLGSGAVLAFLSLTISWEKAYSHFYQPLVWLMLFNPCYFSPDWVSVEHWLSPDESYYESSGPVAPSLAYLQWFFLLIGKNTVSLFGFLALNYGLWTYWIWQALKRCFRNANFTLLSKWQSYLLVGCFEVIIIGFAGQNPVGWQDGIIGNSQWLAWFNIMLSFGLIALLSPGRQALQDWAHHRRERVFRRGNFWNWSLWQDLIWGEKSPAQVAIAINLAIANILWLILPREFLWTGLGYAEKFYINHVDGQKSDSRYLFYKLFFIAVLFLLMMIYASLAQVMLMMKTPNRFLWATGAVTALALLPGLIRYNRVLPLFWVFSIFDWLMPYGEITTITMFLTLLGELVVLVLLNLLFMRQLKKAGESATKALLAGRN